MAEYFGPLYHSGDHKNVLPLGELRGVPAGSRYVNGQFPCSQYRPMRTGNGFWADPKLAVCIQPQKRNKENNFGMPRNPVGYTSATGGAIYENWGPNLGADPVATWSNRDGEQAQASILQNVTNLPVMPYCPIAPIENDEWASSGIVKFHDKALVAEYTKDPENNVELGQVRVKQLFKRKFFADLMNTLEHEDEDVFVKLKPIAGAKANANEA